MSRPPQGEIEEVARALAEKIRDEVSLNFARASHWIKREFGDEFTDLTGHGTRVVSKAVKEARKKIELPGGRFKNDKDSWNWVADD
jgi:hypothetical protein